MEGIQTRPAKVPTKWDKAKKHLVNAGVTGTGLAGTYLLCNKGLKVYSGNYPSKYTKSLGKVFEGLGEKLFNKANNLHVLFENYEKGFGYEGEALTRFVKSNKGFAAICLTAAVTALGFLAHGVYKAGKINGEGK